MFCFDTKVRRMVMNAFWKIKSINLDDISQADWLENHYVRNCNLSSH